MPYRALRECCINAFAHRYYHHLGGSTSIAIYDDRIEITNIGAFPPDLQLERLLDVHDSHPQNPIIANVLYKSGVLENWGRGIKLMVDECRRVDIPDPEFHADGGFVWVVFRYTRVLAGKDHTSTIQDPQSTPQDDPSSHTKTPHKCPENTPQVPPNHPSSHTKTPHKLRIRAKHIKRLIETMGDDAYSIKELLERMNLKDRKNFIKTYLNPAIEEGMVELLFSDRPNHPNQKYRLTKKEQR